MWPECFDGVCGGLLTGGSHCKGQTLIVGSRLIKSIVIGQFAQTVRPRLPRSGVQARIRKKENEMWMIMAAALAMTTSVAIADDVEDAHRQAISGRDSYWNCLALEYTRDGNKSMSDQDFTSISRACVLPSGRISGLRCWTI